MDELPIPCGPWLEHHKKKQAKYNVHLIAGVISFLVSVLVCMFSGLVNWNFSPPEIQHDSEQRRKC